MSTPRITMDFDGANPVIRISKPTKNAHTAKADELLWSSEFIMPRVREYGKISVNAKDYTLMYSRTYVNRPLVMAISFWAPRPNFWNPAHADYHEATQTTFFGGLAAGGLVDVISSYETKRWLTLDLSHDRCRFRQAYKIRGFSEANAYLTDCYYAVCEIGGQ